MKKLFKLCFSMFMAIIMLIGTYSFATSTAKNTYLQLEKKNLTALEKLLTESNLVPENKYNSLRETLEIYGENLPFDFSNIKLKLFAESNLKNNYTYGKFTIGSKTTDKLSYEVIFKDNKLMFQVPELYENYINIDFSNIKEIFEKFEIEVSEEELAQFTELLNNVTETSIISAEDEKYLEEISPKYIAKLNKLFDSKYFSSNNKAQIEYNNQKLNCKSVTCEITSYDLLNIINELLTDVKNDEKLLDIIVKTIKTSGENISKEEIINAFNEIPEILNTSKNDLSEIKIISTLYYNTKKETLKRELNIASSYLQESETISLTTINNTKNAFYELDLNDAKIIDKVTKGNKKSEHNIQIIQELIDYDFNFETYEYIETPYTQTTNCNLIVEEPNTKNTIFTLSIQDIPTKFILNIFNDKVSKNKTLTNLAFTVDTETIDYKVFADYSLEINPKIKEISFNSKEININKMTKEELIAEFEKASTAIQTKLNSIMAELFPTLSLLLSNY